MKQIPRFLPAVAIAVAVFALASATYEHFFSDKAKLIGVLKDQIEEQEAVIAKLETAYAELQQEEQHRLEEITQLKTKLTALRQSIDQGEVNLAHIKNDVTSIGEALDIIAEHTRAVITRGRGVLDSTGARTGRGKASGQSEP